MIKPGMYITRAGWEADVRHSNLNGAIGWVYRYGSDKHAVPISWDENGFARGHGNYDLNLSRTIKIPETELPKPSCTSAPVLTGDFHQSYQISVGVQFSTFHDAEEWAGWWRRVMKGENDDGH